MIRRTQLFTVVAVAAVLTLIVAACGGDAATPTPAPTATPQPTPTPIAIEQPTPQPTATPISVEQPTPQPTATPISVEQPTPQPTATPISVTEPTAQPTPTPQPTATPIPTPDARRGGTLVLPSLGDPGRVDPATARSITFLGVWAPHVYNNIITFNWEPPMGDLIPDLAERWEADGPTFTFHFRDDVSWHDGQPFTAGDAMYSLENQTGRVAPHLKDIVSMSVPDDRTLAVTLEQPRASFLAALGILMNPIYAKHVREAAGGNLDSGPSVGTGPFTEGDYNKGVSVEFLRNDSYFKEGLPYLDAVKFIFIRDFNTRLAGFKAGRLDMLGAAATYVVNQSDIDDLRSTVVDLVPWPHDPLAINLVVINTNVSPWDDVRVRRAAFLAMDRSAALKVLPGSTRVAGPLVGPPGWGLSDEELATIPGYRSGDELEQDRAEARRLLAEAGYPDGFETELLTTSVEYIVAEGEFVKDQLQRIGISSELLVLPAADATARRTDGNFEVSPDGCNVAFPDPDGSSCVLVGGKNLLDDAMMQDLYRQQSAETDPAKRRDLVVQLQQRMIEVVPGIPLTWRGQFWPVQGEVKGFTPPVGHWSYQRWDHVWLQE